MLEIDTLRAIGCLAVVIYHIIWQFNKVAGGDSWLYQLLSREGQGFLGFHLLFIISGYITTRSLRGDPLKAVLKFTIVRIFRLHPSFIITLIIAYIGKQRAIIDWRFFWELAMVPSLAGVEVILGHFWTLEVIALFYLLIVLIFITFGRIDILKTTIAYIIFTFLSSFIYLTRPKNWPHLPMLMSLIFYGACLREATQLKEMSIFGNKIPIRLSRCVVLGAITGLALALPIFGLLSGINEDDFESAHYFLFTTLWILFFLTFVIFFPLRSTLLAKLGRASYSTYLWHMIVVHVVMLGIQSGILGVFAGLPLPFYLIIILPICLITGNLAFRYIEDPAARFGRRLAQRLSSP